MITRKAVEKIDRLVENAISQGARLFCGGAGTVRTACSIIELPTVDMVAVLLHTSRYG